MALIHLSNPKFRRSICGRDTMSSYGKELFIAEYTKANGKNFCSKCANYLIGKKELTLADNTIPQDLQLVISKIEVATENLRLDYMKRTKIFAKRYFEICLEKASWPTQQWYKEYGIETEVKYFIHGTSCNQDTPGAKAETRIASKEYNGKKLYRMRNKRDEVGYIVSEGYDKLLAKELSDAQRHYRDAAMKLAYRIMEKSLNLSKMTVTQGRVNQNIEVTITDGVNYVRAWTIIAAQDSQVMRPHYRYLVK